MGLITKLFGSRSQREIKKILPLVDKILALEPEYKALSEEALKSKTAQFKERLAQGESLDDLLPEAFAAVREAADRVLGMRPYPVQVIGGIVLHQGRIAEMKTGEGKTLVAIMPCYLNALTGEGVHVVTVNDYLAKRDSEWMGKVYRYMGLTVGLIIPGLTNPERRKAYQADITYCTNNELGFDYLRDNMSIYQAELVQGEVGTYTSNETGAEFPAIKRTLEINGQKYVQELVFAKSGDYFMVVTATSTDDSGLDETLCNIGLIN